MNTESWEEDDLSGPEFSEQREHMVQRQIIRRGIADVRLLEALRQVPRHEFVSQRFRVVAYEDSPVPIGFGQTVSQPYIVAFMLERLQLRGLESVLEVGAGSGYQAALLAHLCEEVYSLEIIPELAHRAQALLERLGFMNVTVRCGDGYLGWPAPRSFDRIIVSAAPNHVPERLLEQLAPNGIMILPLGDEDQRLMIVTKDELGAVTREESVAVKFVPMTGLIGSVN
jgi:protein-L-isoaspartate(D-aspartate) O-methyltransferase